MITHPKLITLGWNRRILTYGDFEQFCERENILILDAPLDDWPGFYTNHHGWPVIAIDSRLRSWRRDIVAWHEVGHYLMHAPGHFGYHDKTERQAEIIAHIALMPKRLVQMASSAGEIMEQYGYSYDAVVNRLAIYRQYLQ